MDFLRNLRIDRNSFWAGFIAGMLFLWILSSLRRFIPYATRAIKKQIQIAREKASAGILARFRNDVFIHAQNQHLAAALYPLDQILIPPRLLAPPAPLYESESAESYKQDITSLTIPYLPEWPEMGSVYGVDTLTLAEALHGGSNLILMGNPGSGRTVAMANLASLIAKRDSSIGKLAEYIPFFIHAIDLHTKMSAVKNPKIPDILIGAVSTYSSPFTTSRLQGVLRNALEIGRVLLLIDGFDEIIPEAQHTVHSFLETVFATYPKTRLVVATSTESYAGLNYLGLYPVAMAAWNDKDRADFINQWQAKWQPMVPPSDSSLPGDIDPLLITNWLSTREFGLSPLEFTLKIWGAFAGDTLGPDIPNILEAHIRRLSVNVSNAQPVLEKLAVQMVVNQNIFPSYRQAENWVTHFEKTQPVPEIEEQPSKSKAASEKRGPTSDALYDLTSSGILASHWGAVRFLHPVFLYYLAGRGMVNSRHMETIVEQPEWDIKNQSIAFLGCFGDLSPVVDSAVSATQDPVYSQAFKIARWLRISPKTAAWRNKIMRHLMDILAKESFTIGIEARVISALALSGDPNIAVLFRQMIKGNQPHLQYMGALGCGLLFDAKAIPDLTALFEDEDPRIGGAACLAMVAIGSKAALDAVMALLLQGSENARRLSAEALANHAAEGHPTLEEAATLPDLLVRRSAVFGLKRVRQPWAITILEKMEIEDGQWVVRTAASQAMDEIRQENPHIPHPLPPLTDSPWLINFAGRLGMGVASGKPALDLINKALVNGDPHERLSALEYLQQFGREEVLLQIYQTYYGSQALLRETAFNTLWHYHTSGNTLPPQLQYGLL
jgi:HEAT repeat protein